MINRVVLVGRLTKDPALAYTPSGLAYVRFTLAVNRQFQSQNGEKEADFINCIVWRKSAEHLTNYQKKGNLIGVEGRISTGSYEREGQRIYTTEIVCDSIQFLEPRREQGSVNGNPQNQYPKEQPSESSLGQQNGSSWPSQSQQQQNGSSWPSQSQQQQNGSSWPSQSQQQQNGSSWSTQSNADPFASSNNKSVSDIEQDLPF